MRSFLFDCFLWERFQGMKTEINIRDLYSILQSIAASSFLSWSLNRENFAPLLCIPLCSTLLFFTPQNRTLVEPQRWTKWSLATSDSSNFLHWFTHSKLSLSGLSSQDPWHDRSRHMFEDVAWIKRPVHLTLFPTKDSRFYISLSYLQFLDCCKYAFTDFDSERHLRRQVSSILDKSFLGSLI